jgi:ELWxxDGT repeat protein
MVSNLLSCLILFTSTTSAQANPDRPVLLRLAARQDQPLLFFAATDGKNGRELWCSDGAPGSARMVKDINPKGDSDPRDFILYDAGGATGMRLYFSADDGVHGRELWTSNGTEAGTYMVADIRKGKAGSQPANLTVYFGYLYFTADDGKSGRELWRTNGTEAGTQLVMKINPGKGDGSDPRDLTVYNGRLYFSAHRDLDGLELWSTNGTAAGTEIVKDINEAVGEGSDPTNLTVYNPGDDSGPLLFFTADDGKSGRELWKTNGTEAGTQLVLKINPGRRDGSDPRDLTICNGRLYFSAHRDLDGRELWSTNGTAAGTEIVKDINEAVGEGSDPAELTVYDPGDGTGLLLMFTADDGKRGRELWKTNGTEAGTQLVMKINPGRRDGSDPQHLIVYRDRLYFSAHRDLDGRELWSSNGTAAGTEIVRDINEAVGEGSDPSQLYVFDVGGASGPLLFFAANDGKNGNQLWTTNGTDAGTALWQNITVQAKRKADANASEMIGFDLGRPFPTFEGRRYPFRSRRLYTIR